MKLRSGRVLRRSPKQFKKVKSPKIYPEETKMETEPKMKKENEVVNSNHRMMLRPRK